MRNALLTRLAALADAAGTDSERCVYRAQWACVAARLGQIAKARTEVAGLRALNTSYAPQLTAWIFLAEGLADHFESLSSTALDRFKRAYGLAVAIGDPEILSLAAAWMGASEFLLGHYESASIHAAEAIDKSPATGSLALSRAHLVLANCLSAVGERELAAKHYGKARHFAVDARDISMQSAILYNIAAFHISWISLRDAFGDSVSDQLAVAELEVNSISNLDTGIGLESLGAMVPLLRAQLLLMQRKWLDANALYSAFTTEAASHGQLRLAPRYIAERAHCEVKLGQRDKAAALVLEAISRLSGRVDDDDRAACHARLSLCLAALGEEADSDRHRDAAAKSLADFSAFQTQHRAKIVSIESGLTKHL